jgi:hypothetical protein
MSRHFLAHLIAASAAVLFIAGPCLGAPVFPAGSRIGLEPPGDLKPSARFSGFEDADRKAAITIVDLPAAAYGQLEQAAAAKAQPGLGIKQETFSFHGGSGQLFSGQLQANGTTLHKWILLVSVADKDMTAMVDVEVPETASSVYSDAAIRTALASITFRDAPINEQLALLPFKLGDLAGFHVKKVLPGGVLLTDGSGEDTSKQPYVIVSIGTGAPEAASDRARFARDLLATAPLANIKLQSADSMRINGAPGFELRAEAQGPGGEPVMVAQWLRFSGNGFLRVVGVGDKTAWDATFTRLRALRDGVEIR